jgi:hypothetical protein
MMAWASEWCQGGVKGGPGDMPGLVAIGRSCIEKQFSNAD